MSEDAANVGDSTPGLEHTLISFDGLDDKEDVHQISTARKFLYLVVLTMSSIHLTALSSVWSTASSSIEARFHVSTEVSVLGISLYVLALGIGPLFLAPLSEFYGRRPVYLLSLTGSIAFQCLTAFGPNIGSLLVGRFLTAFMGSAFLTNVAGTASDLFVKEKLGLPMVIVTMGPFVGPGVGPLIGGFITVSVGFRWVFYVFTIWAGVVSLAVLVLVPETYGPILLVAKAKRLRAASSNEKIRAPHEIDDRSFLSVLQASVSRPFLLLVLEPMNLFLCFYTGFLLAIVYFFFVAFPIIFDQVYQFRIQFIGIALVSVTLGMIFGAALYLPVFDTIRRKLIARNNGVFEPEFSLPALCIGGVILTIGLFMFAWTIYSSVHWMVPLVAAAIFGLGTYFAFNAILTYTVATYRVYAASAVAANTFLRCCMACAFPLFGRQMLERMTLHWGMTFIALVALLLTPAGFVLFFYGKRIRSYSKFAFHD